MPDFHLPPTDGYLVAFSGGADSRLLLELTVRAALLRHPGRPVGETVTAAHLHHGIREAEADRDEAFCRAVCDRLGVPLVVEHADVPALAAASGRSLEAEARETRYGFFTRVLSERRIPVLLTAHHADDQLETILHHLLRGSGTRGMGGIPASRTLSCADATEASTASLLASESILPYTATLFRPLLHWTRRDILAACAAWGLDYVTDSTNLVGDCTRNRLRLSVVPALEAVAGEDVPQRAVSRLATAAREDDEALSAIAREKYEAAIGGAQKITEVTDSRKASRATATGRAANRDDPGVPPHVTSTAATVPQGYTPLPVAAVQAEPAAIAKRMIGLAYAGFYRQTEDFHRERNRGSTAQNRGSTVGQFGVKPENPAFGPGERPCRTPDGASADESVSASGMPPVTPSGMPPVIPSGMSPVVSAEIAPDRTLSAYHLEALLALCRAGREGAVSDRLPGDVHAEVRGGRLVFRSVAEPDCKEDAPKPAGSPCPLCEGILVWCAVAGNGRDGAPAVITVETTRAAAPLAPDEGADVWASAVFPAKGLPWPLLLRRREAGDVIVSHGMTKKIKKLLCDKHIPLVMRKAIPLLCLPDGTPLWVPGVAFRDGFPAPEAGEAVRVTVRLRAK